MRSVFAFFCLLGIPLLGYGQSTFRTLSQQVTNLAGAEATLAGSVISSSIGEPAILTFSSGDYFLTQGFLQPELLPCEEVTFRYYPNPARGKITIEAYGCETQIRRVQLVDLWGRLLPASYDKKTNQLSLNEISQGSYLVNVELTNGAQQTIHLVKISD
ncbi:MAG: T9SS type A sorting domain-containing protein [Bacteroidota bacterium]